MKKEIIRVARSWIGTRFHHQGRIKKSEGNRGGCDCIGLLMGVANELDIYSKGIRVADCDQTGYARTPDGNYLYDELCKYLNEVPVEVASEGDIVLFRFEKEPQHVGFLSELEGRQSIIHCYMQARGVVEHHMDEYWQSMVVSAFRF